MNAYGVRRGLHCAGLLSVAALVLLPPLARAQLDAIGYKHAFVDEKTGKRTMLLSGGSVTNIANELLLRDGVRLQFFDDAGKTNFDVTARQCVYNTGTKRVWSGEKLLAGSPDGQFSLEGSGFEYQIGTGSLVVSNEVHAILRKELLEPPSRPAPARGVVPAQTNATAATAQLLHIFSDRMRYQTNFAVFEDHVHVEDPQGRVTCGALTVLFSASSPPGEGRRVEKILAEQRVVIDSDEVHATGDQATYGLTTDVVELTGHPTWRLRQYEGRAEELVVNRKTREFHATRGVEMTLPPGSIGQKGFLLPESPANAAPTKGRPVEVRGDDFEFKPDAADTNLNLAVFNGNVRANSGDGNLSCELMTIQSSAPSNRTESVVAERRVVIEQGDGNVKGERAVYTAISDTVEVTGQPEWKMGPRVGSAEVLAFDLTNGVYRATGNVRMRLPPDSFGRTPWLLPKSGANTNAPATAGVTVTAKPSRPIEISSEDFEFQSATTGAGTETVIYRGAVRVSDPDRMKLSCELLTAKMLSGSNQVEGAVAEREVEIEVHEPRGERRARGDKAVYTAGNGEVALTGRDGVEMVFVDPKIQGRGTGAQAVYAADQDVLELTGNPVLTAPQGQLWGDVVILDRANTTLKARGNWRMKLNPEALRKQATPTPPKSGS